MAKTISIWLGGVIAIGMMAAALWAWRFAPEIAFEHSGRPYVAGLGIRSLSIALAAGAQVVLLMFVVARLYPPRAADRVLSVGIAVVSFAAMGTAIVLALSSR